MDLFTNMLAFHTSAVHPSTSYPVLSLRLYDSKFSLLHYLNVGCSFILFSKQNEFSCEMNNHVQYVDGKGSAYYILETFAFVDSGLNH